MSRVLRTFLVCFQWLPLAPGISVRHACDMNEKSFLASDVTRDDVSNFLLGSTELARLGAFERAPWVDSEAFAAADYELRIALLGVGDLGDRKKNPPHRPPSVDTALKRDRIVQAVLFEAATNFEKPMKQIIGEVGDHYRVKDRRVYDCIEETPPERRKAILESILVMCFWPYAMMLAYGVSANTVSTDPRGRLALAILGALSAKT